MQSHVSGAQTPVITPDAPPRGPAAPISSPPWLRRAVAGVALLLIALMIAGFFWARKAANPPPSGKAEGPAPVRTATVRTGDLEQTLRLTGVTVAGSFATLIGPQLRGSRSRSGRSYSRDSSYSASDTTGGTSDTGSIAASALPSAGVLEKATQRPYEYCWRSGRRNRRRVRAERRAAAAGAATIPVRKRRGNMVRRIGLRDRGTIFRGCSRSRCARPSGRRSGRWTPGCWRAPKAWAN